MSTRKHIREIYRKAAEHQKVPASRFVRYEWDKHQTAIFGKELREAHQAMGTHLRRTWANRINPPR